MNATCKAKPGIEPFNEPARALKDDEGRESRDGSVAVLDLPEPVREPTEAETGGVLVCRACRSRITRRDLGMEVDGSHRHVFFNPAGLVFELGCFASAKNLLPTGPRTDEFTWFPGYEWQAVACTGCVTQLGWRYTGAQGGFFGLILSALMEEEPGIRP